MKRSVLRKKSKTCWLTLGTVLLFLLHMGLPARFVRAENPLNLPDPGTRLTLSPSFQPTILKGLTVHPQDPFLFDFIINPGDHAPDEEQLQAESVRLIKYFMAALTVPEDEMWVNLSPYEKDRIIPAGFGDTEMGRDLLAQDYMLKQLTASLMYPEQELGSEFWTRVYQKAQERYGATDIPMNTFNKVWIVPDKAVIVEDGPNVFVLESRLKVMLEEDYLALEVNRKQTQHGLGLVGQTELSQISDVSAEVIKEIILPEIEREVNEGELFANLRQISNSVILATWYKRNVQGSILDQVYINQNKTGGIDTRDKAINNKIYAQYVAAFKKGVYDFIKEEYNPATQEMIPRKYFSGGMVEKWTGKIESYDRAMLTEDLGQTRRFRVALQDLTQWNLSGRPDRLIQGLYVDAKGRVRIDVQKIDNAVVKNFLKEAERSGLKQHIFLIGADVRDVLLGKDIGRLRFYVSNDIDPDAEQSFRDKLSADTYARMGRISDYPLSGLDLSVDRIMISFLPFQTDPVINDAQGGLFDLLNYQARLNTQVDADKLTFRFPQLVRSMVRFDLAPDVQLSQATGEFLEWVDGPFLSTLAQERQTPDDREMLLAAEVYRIMTRLQNRPENYQEHLGQLWELLEQWAAVRGVMQNEPVSVQDVFDFADPSEMQAHFQRMAAVRPVLNAQHLGERELRNLGAVADAQDFIDENMKLSLADLKPGDWVVSAEHGLLIVLNRDHDQVQFARVTQNALVQSFALEQDQPVTVDTSAGTLSIPQTANMSFLRWQQRRGRIVSISEQAYRLARSRARQQFDIEQLSLQIAFDILQDRVKAGGALAAVYQDILAQQRGPGQTRDEQIEQLARAVKAPTAAERQQLRRLFRAAYLATSEDLVKSGILKLFRRAQDGTSDQVLAFAAGEQPVSADVYFYLTTELLENGMDLFETDIEDYIAQGRATSNVAAETLYPRSHPSFPYDAFSNLYFAAKQDQGVMDELSRKYADALIDLIAERDIALTDLDYIVPVPKLRGEYNQLFPLVQAMAELSGVPVNNDLIEKTQQKSKQKEIKSLIGKGMNVADAYRVLDPGQVAGKTILLVDDHSGTGLTLNQIKKEFYDAGAKRVVVSALTDSPKKLNVNLEVAVKQVSQESGQGIGQVQEILRPDAVGPILAEAIISAQTGSAEAFDADMINRTITDRFFANNLVDAWAAEFSGGMMDRQTMQARLLKVYRLFAHNVLRDLSRPYQPAGSLNLNTNPQQSLEYLTAILQGADYNGVNLAGIELVLSDYDGTLAKGFRQLGPQTAGVIAQILQQGKTFALVTQQSMEEIQQLFVAPVKQYLEQQGRGLEALEGLYIFPAGAHLAYKVRARGAQVTFERQDGLAPLLTPEHLDALHAYDLDLQPAYIANREDGILTYYFRTPFERSMAMEVMQTVLAEESIPATVVRNGYLRMRVIPQGLIKTRARDFMQAVLPQISPEQTAVLGDNFDPEDPLSDSGLVFEGDHPAAKQQNPRPYHRELVRQLQQKHALKDILSQRGMGLGEGLRGYEAKIFLTADTNIYWQRNGELLDLATALSLLQADSLVYFLANGDAILVDDSQALEAVGARDERAEPEDLYTLKNLTVDQGDREIYQWLKAQTVVRGHIQVVEINPALSESFGLPLEGLREKLLSTFKMVQIDGEPLKFIHFRDVADTAAEDRAPASVDAALLTDTKGGIDLNQNINRIEKVSTGRKLVFDLPQGQAAVAVDKGLIPVILSVRPFSLESESAWINFITAGSGLRRKRRTELLDEKPTGLHHRCCRFVRVFLVFTVGARAGSGPGHAEGAVSRQQLYLF